MTGRSKCIVGGGSKVHGLSYCVCVGGILQEGSPECNTTQLTAINTQRNGGLLMLHSGIDGSLLYRLFSRSTLTRTGI